MQEFLRIGMPITGHMTASDDRDVACSSLSLSKRDPSGIQMIDHVKAIVIVVVCVIKKKKKHPTSSRASFDGLEATGVRPHCTPSQGGAQGLRRQMLRCSCTPLSCRMVTLLFV